MSKKTGKAAVKDKEAATYRERDIVLGKVRGFPPWPGMRAPRQEIQLLLCPVLPRRRLVRPPLPPAAPAHLHSAWLVAKDISRLQPLEIEAYINEPFKKSGDLLAGYRTALDPAAWEAKRAQALADDADDDGDAAPEDAGEDVDELASEHEGDVRKRGGGGAGRKRKREKEGGGKREKDAKTRKGKTPRAKARKGKSSAVVESEDDRADPDDDADGDDVARKPASPPPAKKPRKDDDPDERECPSLSSATPSRHTANMQDDRDAIKVRDWRHKLQKAFLSAKSTPDDAVSTTLIRHRPADPAQDMPALDSLFATVEAYSTMTVAQLQFSKIGKVMRHITLLEDKRVPRDAEFSFRARAQALVERWQSVLGAAKGAVAVKKDEPKDGVNGVNGAPEPETADAPEPAKLEVNGASAADADADMAAPADVDAPGEADGEAEAEGEVVGQADAPGEAEAEDVVMA
ncbi:hypothetical protein C0993_002146 [Termitomyces sp. T159_Od127]|nr:hypothetical protein C0993_002146 [Termitomyces sp. T159_Od127]